MSHSAQLNTVQQHLLEPAGLTLATLEQVLGAVAGPGVDLADLYFEYSRGEGFSLEDGIVRDGSYSLEQGVGIRVVSGEKNRFRLLG